MYKAAAEIGELGDNTAALREALIADDLLRRAVGNLQAPQCRVRSSSSHTRWASGRNHLPAERAPAQQSEETSDCRGALRGTPVLNGDVDNFADLTAANEDLEIPPADHHRRKGDPHPDQPRDRAWCRAGYKPSAMAVPAHDRLLRRVRWRSGLNAATASDPTLLLALRGSGQALYVGAQPKTRFVVASEPYGVVEVTAPVPPNGR